MYELRKEVHLKARARVGFVDDPSINILEEYEHLKNVFFLHICVYLDMHVCMYRHTCTDTVGLLGM
jgi:hypothetical protein